LLADWPRAFKMRLAWSEDKPRFPAASATVSNVFWTVCSDTPAPKAAAANFAYSLPTSPKLWPARWLTFLRNSI
jgi:hypothetical protein